MIFGKTEFWFEIPYHVYVHMHILPSYTWYTSSYNAEAINDSYKQYGIMYMDRNKDERNIDLMNVYFDSHENKVAFMLTHL